MYIRNMKLESARSCSNEVESYCNIFPHPLVGFYATESIFRKIEVKLCVHACVCAYLLFCECLHMCTLKLTAVGDDHPQSKETKKENQAHETWKKEASVVLWLFCLKACDPNLSHQEMGNTSVILILNCKSSLSLIHIKCSLTLDTATSAICGCIDNARLPVCHSDIKTQSLNCSLVTFYVVTEFDILLRWTRSGCRMAALTRQMQMTREDSDVL